MAGPPQAAATMARLFSPRPPPSEDLFYETYYSLSQQYPLLLLLLMIVLCALGALLAVAWASGRVSWACDHCRAGKKAGKVPSRHGVGELGGVCQGFGPVFLIVFLFAGHEVWSLAAKSGVTLETSLAAPGRVLRIFSEGPVDAPVPSFLSGGLTDPVSCCGPPTLEFNPTPDFPAFQRGNSTQAPGEFISWLSLPSRGCGAVVPEVCPKTPSSHSPTVPLQYTFGKDGARIFHFWKHFFFPPFS